MTKLTFEANLQFQQDAIKSITDLFEGQPLDENADFKFDKGNGLSLIGCAANNLVLEL